jgi:hypothetical protein
MTLKENFKWSIQQSPCFIQILEEGMGNGNRVPCLVAEGLLKRNRSMGRLSRNDSYITYGEDYD